MHFHASSPAITEPHPLCSLILKTDHENRLLGGIHLRDIHLETVSGTATLTTLRRIPFFWVLCFCLGFCLLVLVCLGFLFIFLLIDTRQCLFCV